MKVAIVGGAPSSQMLAPFDDPEWDIWVLGNQLQDYEGKRVSMVFEIHDYLEDKDPKYPQWLVQQNIPLVVGDQFPFEAERFPVNEANELLGGEFLSSSPAYMMALAILEGAEEIGIYGVDMAVDNHEYFKQRPEMYAWIAFAKAKGIKVTIPNESCLFKGRYVEGRDWGTDVDLATPPFTEKQFNAMAEIHQHKMNECEQEIRRIQAVFNSHDGCRQAYERLAKIARSIEAGINVNSLTETYIGKI